MIKFFLAAVSAVMLSFSAQAQSDVDPERMELARELVRISGAEIAMNEMMTMMMPTIRPALVAENPSASTAQINQAMSIIEGAMMGAMPEMLEASAAVYARRFTAAELREINEFYRSPVGSKLASELQSMMVESGTAGEQIAMRAVLAVGPEISAALAPR